MIRHDVASVVTWPYEQRLNDFYGKSSAEEEGGGGGAGGGAPESAQYAYTAGADTRPLSGST
jgi:hypothetical protein